jgi:ClpP class serine protease
MASLPAPFSRIIDEQNTMRRELITKIQDVTQRKTMSYIANVDAPVGNVINYHDATIINDILSLLKFPKDLDIIIHSTGGTVEATQKLVLMLRDKVTSLRVIVPEMAKSAATLFSFASDEILMSYMAELGPIDPQILVGFDPSTRQPIYRPAWSVIHSVENIEKDLKKGRDERIMRDLLGQINPLLIDVASKAIDFSKSLAKEWLHTYMGLEKEKAEEIANDFTDLKRHLSHGKVINYKAAREKGLKITKIDENSELWKLISEFHLRTKLTLVPPKTKVFDCEKHSYFQEIAIKPPLR